MGPPVGTVALLFTDIEGSTVLARTLGAAWPAVLSAHHDVVGGAIAEHGGHVDRTEGDAFFALFADARAAVAAAVAAQRALRARRWPTPDGRLRVRMGLHAGHVELGTTGYVGLEIHRAARVGAAAHGGQLLLTEAVLALARDAVETDDLGEHRLKDFPSPERLHCAVIDGEGAGSFPPPRTEAVRPTNLPADDRLLIGRETAVQEVAAAFAGQERLVTLTGMGGTGKTRLALAVGGALLERHPGGVWWVPLAGIAQGDAPLTALAGAMRLSEDGSRPLLDALAARIADRPTLAVVDNLEHLPDAGPQLAALLAAAPGLRVLATSRLPLRVAAERVVALPPLAPEAAVELLRRLGQRASPGLELDEALGAELCARLDGLPLAIELAAARLTVLTPRQLLERLTAPLSVLTSARRDLPERQRSLRATVDWTLGLLGGDARELFRRLGAFAGPVELEDLEALCGDDGLPVLDAVAELVEASLLRRVEDRGVVRFGLPEALRQIARELLDAAADGAHRRRRHADHVSQVAWHGSLAFIATVAESRRTAALQREVLAALDWSREHHPPAVAALAAGRAAWLWNAGPLAEPLALAREALAQEGLPPEIEARALLVLDTLEWRLGRQRREAMRARRAADLLPVGHETRIAALAGIAIDQARSGFGDPRASAAAAFEEARRHGSPASQAGAAFAMAQVLIAVDDPEAAAEALDLAARLTASGGLMGQRWVDNVRADVDLALGAHREAAAGYIRSMEQAWADGELGQLFNDLHTTAAAFLGAGHTEAALEVHAMGLAHGEEMGQGDRALDWLVDRTAIAAAQEALGAEVAAAATARGRAVPLERRIDRARELVQELAAAEVRARRAG